jgi:hypothetical protein
MFRPATALGSASLGFSMSAGTTNQPCSMMTDELAQQIEQEWKMTFPDATMLPVIGSPSNNNGVMTLTHSMGAQMPKLMINGLTSLSPLANNALFSSECSQGQYLNLYEIMIPDRPGVNGRLSTGQMYTKSLMEWGVHVAGNHYHWNGMEPFMLAIHSQNIGMDPLQFAQAHISALNEVMPLLFPRRL